MLAVCPNSSEVWIFTGCQNPDTSTWTKRWTLKEHDSLVSGIDWHPTTNSIVTCAHDRNAFVWKYDAATDSWQAQVCLLGLKRAAISVKWSPDGKKFAVTSSEKITRICRYEADNNWWIYYETKKHGSTVLASDWHPSGHLFATASTDFTCRISSGLVKETDGSEPDPAVLSMFPIPKLFKKPGTPLYEVKTNDTWVHDCAWSPDGYSAAFCCYDSTVQVTSIPADAAASAGPTTSIVKLPGLPANRVLWLSPSLIVAAGHSNNPELIAREGTEWKYAGVVDSKEADGAARGNSLASSFGSARALFAAKVDRGIGQAGGATDGSAAGEASGEWTKHQASITFIQPYRRSVNDKQVLTAFSTSGIDGRVVVWDLLKIPHVASRLGVAA